LKSNSRGIIALILVSVILLISDLQNRNVKKSLDLTIPDKYRATNDSMPVTATHKLAMVHYIDSPNSEACEKGIRKALEDKGLRDGVDFTLKVYNAQGDFSTLNSIAGMISNESWDLVFVTSTPTVQLMAKKLPNLKIVFTNVGDPLAAGLGKSFDDHLPNLCGISTMSDFEGLLKLVQYLHPGIKRAGTVFTPAEINSVSYKDRLVEAAKKKGIEMIAVPANSASEVLDAANSMVAQRIDAFCQISDNLTASSCSAILKVSLDNKIPYYGFVTDQIYQGAVAVCARDYSQAGYEAGQMGIDILSGKNPAQIPHRYVEKTDYLISQETARLHNIPIPGQVFTAFPQLKIIEKEHNKAQ